MGMTSGEAVHRMQRSMPGPLSEEASETSGVLFNDEGSRQDLDRDLFVYVRTS